MVDQETEIEDRIEQVCRLLEDRFDVEPLTARSAAFDIFTILVAVDHNSEVDCGCT